MQTITTTHDIPSLRDNQIIGPLTLQGTEITFQGKNNILYCDDRYGVPAQLTGCTFQFTGDNAIVYLCASRKPIRVNLTVHNDTVFFCGHDTFFNDAPHVIVSEHTCVLIGDGCLLSHACWMRTADPHPIYDCETLTRINVSRSIFLGDHVWIGQGTGMLKGTRIGSGSIIGAQAMLAGKRVPSNTAWGGNPARLLRRGVFFLGSSVHGYSKADTEKSMHFRRDDFIYTHSPEDAVPFDDIDAALDALSTPMERVHYLDGLRQNTAKNRFYIGEDSKEGAPT